VRRNAYTRIRAAAPVAAPERLLILYRGHRVPGRRGSIDNHINLKKCECGPTVDRSRRWTRRRRGAAVWCGRATDQDKPASWQCTGRLDGAATGSQDFTPPGTMHAFRNRSPRAARQLMIFGTSEIMQMMQEPRQAPSAQWEQFRVISLTTSANGPPDELQVPRAQVVACVP
jgi:hypothetical protein